MAEDPANAPAPGPAAGSDDSGDAVPVSPKADPEAQPDADAELPPVDPSTVVTVKGFDTSEQEIVAGPGKPETAPVTVWAVAKSSLRRNVAPGLALQCIAILLVVLYYNDDATRAGFDRMADFKARTGYGYSFVATAICGGLIPSLIMAARDLYTKTSPLTIEPAQIRRGRELYPDARPLVGRDYMIACICFLSLYWGYKGIEVDAFYRMQGVMFGDGTDARTIVIKVVIDQFVYNPIWAVHSGTIPYFFMDCGFSWT